MAQTPATESNFAELAGSSEHDDRQYGRSSSSLRAERAAAALRETEPSPAISSSGSSQSNEFSGAAESNILVPSIMAPSLPPTRRPSYAPSVPSPLNPNISLDRVDSQSRSSDETKSTGKVSALRSHGPSAPPKRLQKRIPKQKHIDKPEKDAPRVLTPLAISDLGSDYTRYFSPFPETRQSSIGGGTTMPPLHEQHGSLAPATPPNIDPFLTPQRSRTNLNTESDGEMNIGLINDRLGAPYTEKDLGWLYKNDGPEDDDDMHMPTSEDDTKFKSNWRERFHRDNIVSTIGAIIMMLGLTFVFVALPMLSYSGFIGSGSSSRGQPWNPYPPPEPWATVNNRTYPLLKNIRTGLIDPSTPKTARTKKDSLGDDMILVFSDEFNRDNRTFYEGDDPFWYAPDIWYGATKDLEWYDPDAVTTWDGTLEVSISSVAVKVFA